jgi:hypothetical protein
MCIRTSVDTVPKISTCSVCVIKTIHSEVLVANLTHNIEYLAVLLNFFCFGVECLKADISLQPWLLAVSLQGP